MRFVNSGNPSIEIVTTDNPSFGGANHEYYIGPVQSKPRDPDVAYAPVGEYGHAFFQKGPVGENGHNGCHQEDLIAIVIDRLRSFQDGPYPCRENALALNKLEEALHWLNHRTKNRLRRDVEGKFGA